MKRATVTISFRVNHEVAALIEKARVPFGLSPGEYVRGVITRSLDDRDGGRLTEELIGLRESIADVAAENQATQQSLRKLAYVLLTKLADLPADSAREAIRNIFADDTTGGAS